MGGKLIFAPQEIGVICLSATMPDLTELASWIRTVRRGQVDVASEVNRPVPLKHAIHAEDFGVGSLDDLDPLNRKPLSTQVLQQEWAEVIERSAEADLIDHIVDHEQLPCLYFSSSRKQCEDRAFENTDRDLLTDEERMSILSLYDRICIEHNMASDKGAAAMRDLVSKGVAYHHAGMLPTMKDLVERMFDSRLLKLLFTTETFALGVNMPACSVVLGSLEKYDGTRMRPLKAGEYQQMAGRAGRRGVDARGFAYTRVDTEDII